MTTIYDLTNDYLDVIDTITTSIEEGNDVDYATALSAIGLQDSIKVKAVNTAKVIKNINGSVSAIDEEIKRLTAKKKTHERKVEWLKGLIVYSMDVLNTQKIDDDILPLRMQDNSVWSVSIINDALIPDEYKNYKEVVSIDKKRILADKEKFTDDAVVFSKGAHLRIGT